MEPQRYTLQLWRYHAEEEVYKPYTVEYTVQEAQQAYDDAVRAGEQAETDRACSILNQVRAKAGLSHPVC